MLFEPIGCGEGFDGGGEFGVDVGEGLSEFGGGNFVGRSFVGVGDEGFVELGVQSFSEAEHGEEAIVYGGEMAEEVVDAVPAGSDFLLQLFVAQWSGELIETAECELPIADGDAGEEFFVCHFSFLRFVLVGVRFWWGLGTDSVGVSLMCCWWKSCGNITNRLENARTSCGSGGSREW